MQMEQVKYRNQSGRKIWLTSFILLVPMIWLSAQQPEWADSVKELKYQLDTVSVMDTVIPSPETYEEVTVEIAEDENEKGEYFLKKEFTGGFTDTLLSRSLPAGNVKAFKEDRAFWYADETFKKRKEKQEGSNLSGNSLLQTILWLVIIGGFITFLVIYLSNSNTGLFRKSRLINEEETGNATDDIFSINYAEEIDKAASVENYRLAVRLMFLRLLRNLSDAGIIQYKQDSTNLDFLTQLHGTPLFSDFLKLARSYEYSWYGYFQIDRAKYAQLKNAFENYELSVKK